MRTLRQRRAADRQRLRRLVTSVGATPGDLARLTKISANCWQSWLRGPEAVPAMVLQFLEAAFDRLPDGDLQGRIDTILQLRENLNEPGVETTFFEISTDPVERAEMRRKVESGRFTVRTPCGSIVRHLDRGERDYLLQQLDKPVVGAPAAMN